ncbi:MAG: hypothetical protein MUC80_01840 [Candidatus Thermoplasmatota archaeon]|jgi:hypothetical protein|nr:hypothetical protein [Candidatus Thermoplasmatota archaeon]
MNREAVPLLLGILIPIIIVALIVLYLNGFDITIYLRKINIMYYLILLPFALGLLVIIFWFRKPRD